MLPLTIITGLCCLLASLSARSDAPAPERAELRLTLLTYNIRFATAADGPDSWPHRRELALGVLDRHDADFVGLQEVLRSQLDEITARFPGYAIIGVGRDDGATGGEHTAILYRPARFAIAEAGTFWLSDTPAEIASTSWGNTITRTCTWARLIDRSSGRGVYIYNTHLDHVSQPSRERSTRLITEHIAQRSHPDPVVLMGDFNAGESNPAFTGLLTPAPGGPGLIDTFRAVHPDADAVGTFHAFKGARDGEKIDHILVTPGASIRAAGIDHHQEDDRYPSDHFPVWASVSFL